MRRLVVLVAVFTGLVTACGDRGDRDYELTSEQAWCIGVLDVLGGTVDPFTWIDTPALDPDVVLELVAHNLLACEDDGLAFYHGFPRGGLGGPVPNAYCEGRAEALNPVGTDAQVAAAAARCFDRGGFESSFWRTFAEDVFAR